MKTKISKISYKGAERIQIDMPQKNVSIEVSGRRIFLKMPKNNTDVQFIRSFRYANALMCQL